MPPVCTVGQFMTARDSYGEWPTPQGLKRSDRERLTGGLGAALEALSGIPGALETQLPPTIPKLK